jgi:hypothetical protein
MALVNCCSGIRERWNIGDGRGRWVRILGSETGLEILNQGIRVLFRGSRIRAVRITEVSNPVFTVSLDNSLVEKRGVTVTKYNPPLFGSLDVVGFFFCKQIMVLVGEFLL